MSTTDPDPPGTVESSSDGTIGAAWAPITETMKMAVTAAAPIEPAIAVGYHQRSDSEERL